MAPASAGAIVVTGPRAQPSIRRATSSATHIDRLWVVMTFPAASSAAPGARPVQQLADALGYEHDNGRARRVMRGVYAPGELSPSRRRHSLEASRARAA